MPVGPLYWRLATKESSRVKVSPEFDLPGGYDLEIEFVPEPGLQSTRTIIIEDEQGKQLSWTHNSSEAGKYLFSGLSISAKYSIFVRFNDKTQTFIENYDFNEITEAQVFSERVHNGDLIYLLSHRIESVKGSSDTAFKVTLGLGPYWPQFGLFFDGTGNNLSNDLAGRSSNAPSNVGKLSRLYINQPGSLIESGYVEGVGTTSGEGDSTLDQGFAFTFGKRVQAGIEMVEGFFANFPTAQEGIIDVFGFSRGAAAARSFANELFLLMAKDPQAFGGVKLRIRFMGIFDTVGSIGWAGDNDNHNFYAGWELEGKINLDVDPENIDFVFHLTAINEYRNNFPLSSLKSKNGSLPANFEEIELPGAHSDIGGGYKTEKEVLKLAPRPIYYNHSSQFDEKYEKFKNNYQDSYEMRPRDFPGQNYIFTVGRQVPVANDKRPYRYFRRVSGEWDRGVISGELSHYSLEMMHAKAKEKDVPFNELAVLSQLSMDWKVPQEMRRLVSDSINKGQSSLAFSLLFRGYIHHSHKYSSFTDDLALGPERDVDEPTSNGIRTIFYNDIQNAKNHTTVSAEEDQWEDESA